MSLVLCSQGSRSRPPYGAVVCDPRAYFSLWRSNNLVNTYFPSQHELAWWLAKTWMSESGSTTGEKTRHDHNEKWHIFISSACDVYPWRLWTSCVVFLLPGIDALRKCLTLRICSSMEAPMNMSKYGREVRNESFVRTAVRYRDGIKRASNSDKRHRRMDTCKGRSAADRA